MIGCTASLYQIADVPPVHANEMNGVVVRDSSRDAKRVLEEGDEFRLSEFAACHRELAMLCLSTSDDVAHAHIVRWIQESHGGFVVRHQLGHVARSARVTTEETMTAQLPKITGLGCRRSFLAVASVIGRIG